MQPIVSGVYMLFLRHELVYVGRSLDCYKRIAAHRTKGRNFDYSLVAPCPASDVTWVEGSLIASMDAKQNRMADRAARAAKIVALPASPSPVTIAVGNARSRAAQSGVSNTEFNAALDGGEMQCFAPNPRTPARRVVPLHVLDAWLAARQKLKMAG